MAEAWAPTLADVGRHIPLRTRDARTPGSDALLGTFTSSTTPTDEQAQGVIDDAVAGIVASMGPLPLSPPASDQIAVAARTAAEWRAAADIEVAFPNRDQDVVVYTQLDARATAALATLAAVLKAAGTGAVDIFPVWQSPDPPLWADIDL